MSRAPIADDAARGEPSLVARQIGVAIWVMAAGAATAAVFGFGAGPLAGLPAATVWAIAALGPLVCLLASVAALANGRFFSAQDIDAATGGPPSARARMTQAVIQNTLEQTVLALGVYALLVISLPEETRRVIWAMSAAFVIGRAAFAIGYRFGAVGRAFGFGLTFYPTVIGLIWAAWRLLS